ncbi:DUF4397 domain-containing protein [Lacinutrix jangbogonensis]|uniref:DUF4397 domain-containing protein n=1 Tax=Lacinutrix jangbogonensis TaxID=1469557 RepID=UPI00053D9C65|nr:DUF4397 domain-containing protein [Lacinutrix jangbogonensis]
MQALIIKPTLLFFVLLILSSCSGSDSNEEPITPPTEFHKANVFMQNYYTENTLLNWGIEEIELIDNQNYAYGNKVEFEWETTKYSVLFDVTDSNNSHLISSSHTLSNGKLYYASMIGSSAHKTMVFSELDETIPETGNVRVKYFNANQNIGAIDIYIGGETSDKKVVSNLNFGQLSSYIEVNHNDISSLVVVTPVGIAPHLDTNLLRLSDNTSHGNNSILIIALATLTNENSSELSYFVTEQ